MTIRQSNPDTANKRFFACPKWSQATVEFIRYVCVLTQMLCFGPVPVATLRQTISIHQWLPVPALTVVLVGHVGTNGNYSNCTVQLQLMYNSTGMVCKCNTVQYSMYIMSSIVSPRVSTRDAHPVIIILRQIPCQSLTVNGVNGRLVSGLEFCCSYQRLDGCGRLANSRRRRTTLLWSHCHIVQNNALLFTCLCYTVWVRQAFERLS